MEARQAQAVAVAERERHERERQEREQERERERQEHRRPESHEGYHSRPPSSGGQMRPLDRPPEARPHSNHMQDGLYPFPYMGLPPRSESASSGGPRPPSTDLKAQEAPDRRQETHFMTSFKDSGSKTGGGDPGGGGGGCSGGGGGNEAPRTLTAATLIDAIIIHQINHGANTSDEKKLTAYNTVHGQHHPPGAQGDGLSPMAAPPINQPHKQLPQSSQAAPQLPQHPSQYISPHHSHQPHGHHPTANSRPDTTKGRPEQRSPPYKPHKAISRYEADIAASYRNEQQMPQREPTNIVPNHQGGPVSSSADVERSQGGSPSSDRSNKSTASAQSSSSSRAITLGEHIDAIIIQDYTRKGHSGSPNGSCQAEQTSKSDRQTASRGWHGV